MTGTDRPATWGTDLPLAPCACVACAEARQLAGAVPADPLRGYRDYATWPDPAGRARGDYDDDPRCGECGKDLSPFEIGEHGGNICDRCGQD